MHVVWVCLGVVRDWSESREVSGSTVKYQKRIQRGKTVLIPLKRQVDVLKKYVFEQRKQRACMIHVALRLKEQ